MSIAEAATPSTDATQLQDATMQHDAVEVFGAGL